MLSISHIFIIIFTLSVSALILAVIEWFHLSSLSSLSVNLEREIDKKSQEFDTFRKDRAVLQQNHTVYAHPSLSIEPSAPSDNLNQIQIIRNIGGTFRDTSQISTESHTIIPLSQSNNYQNQPDPYMEPRGNGHNPISNDSHDTNTISDTALTHLYNQSLPPHSQAVPPAAHISDGQQNKQHYTSPGNRQDYQRQNVQPSLHNEKSQSNLGTPLRKITLYLYSDTLKDADFNGLGNSIATYFSSGNPVAVIIDFSGIQFIYENEIEYLEKICMYIESLNGTFTLVHCDNEIAALMHNHPQLYSKISTQNI